MPRDRKLDEPMGVDLLLSLPGVDGDRHAVAALRRLERAMADGDTCIDLGELHEQGHGPEPAAWRASLLASGLVGEGEAALPLILDGELLSSRRYWHYERRIAAELRRRAADRSRLAGLEADPLVARDLLGLFPSLPVARIAGVDWQRLAAAVALGHGLSVITGGPGTGKTTVAGKTIALLARLAERAGGELQVVIAAPTGKAAQRLRESLIATGRELLAQGVLTQDQLARLTERVATLHRLLHDRRLPRTDLVVIDEVSMADAATLARVLARIPASARIMLLGDPQQLASVDAGHVLSEVARFADQRVDPELAAWYSRLTDEAASGGGDLHPLAACQVRLRKNWRSAASPAISAVATAMQASTAEVLAALADPELGPAAGRLAEAGERRIPVWVERRDCRQAGEVATALCADSRDWAAAVVGATDPLAALVEHGRRRLLCARRAGPLGAAGLNRRLEDELEEAGIIHRWDDGHYHGRPLMVTRNDYDLQLFNGDIGIVHGRRGRARACFPDSSGELREIALHRLHEVEPVFAMSIHKSQGSQFEQVDILTAVDDSGEVGQLLTRELCYTALTRAAYSARIWADEDLLARALERRHVRRTGLGRFLA